MGSRLGGKGTTKQYRREDEKKKKKKTYSDEVTLASVAHGDVRRIMSRASRAMRATEGASLSHALVSCATSDGGRATSYSVSDAFSRQARTHKAAN